MSLIIALQPVSIDESEEELGEQPELTTPEDTRAAETASEKTADTQPIYTKSKPESPPKDSLSNENEEVPPPQNKHEDGVSVFINAGAYGQLAVTDLESTNLARSFKLGLRVELPTSNLSFQYSRGSQDDNAGAVFLRAEPLSQQEQFGVFILVPQTASNSGAFAIIGSPRGWGRPINGKKDELGCWQRKDGRSCWHFTIGADFRFGIMSWEHPSATPDNPADNRNMVAIGLAMPIAFNLLIPLAKQERLEIAVPIISPALRTLGGSRGEPQFLEETIGNSRRAWFGVEFGMRVRISAFALRLSFPLFTGSESGISGFGFIPSFEVLPGIALK